MHAYRYMMKVYTRSTELIQPSFSAMSALVTATRVAMRLTWVVGDLRILCGMSAFGLQGPAQRHSLDQTTLPPVVTNPSSLTFTSMMVPLVRTPNEVYSGD